MTEQAIEMETTADPSPACCTVTTISKCIVKPSSPTPSATLPLAWVDRYPTHRGLVDSMHIYASSAAAGGRSPGEAIRDGLAKALVFYYPLAGRIVEPQPGLPAIECSRDGVYFVEAAADCRLEDVRFLERPLMVPKEALVPVPVAGEWAVEPHSTIIMMQVTTFTCGGFVLGLRTNHAAADGMGSAQFMLAVGDMARGLAAPSVMPVWDRHNFPDPPIKPGPLPELPVLALDYIVLDFPSNYIAALKSRYAALAGAGKICSGFDALTAKLWQCRTRALRCLAPEASVKLCFFASVRHLLNLDKGYYGNSIFPVKVTASCGTVRGLSVPEIIGIIREAKEKMAGELRRFAAGKMEDDPFQMSFGFETVYVSDWSKLGFAEVDYGFGPPRFCGPLVNNDYISSAVILRSPAPAEGTRILASCATKEYSAEFARGMRDLLH